MSYQSRSVVRLSVRPSVHTSFMFFVNVSPLKPLEVATSNFVAERSHDVEGTGQHLVSPQVQGQNSNNVFSCKCISS